MIKSIKKWVRGVYHFLKIQKTKSIALKAVKNSKLNTYYPEKKLKTAKEQKNELIKWAKNIMSLMTFIRFMDLM